MTKQILLRDFNKYLVMHLYNFMTLINIKHYSNAIKRLLTYNLCRKKN